MLLADLGADVVKVEPPEGDATRAWGPPWVGDEAAGTRTAAYYLAVNRNKRSIRLDLKHGGRRETSCDGCSRPRDVLVENHRVGGLERLGFGDAALAAINPDLVHLAITGFGPDGPDADKPGYDFVVAGGRRPDVDHGPARRRGRAARPRSGVAISDVVTGLFAAVSILAALLGRERAGRTGSRGQRIDVSLLESTLAVLVNQAQNAFVTGRAPGRLGNAHPNIVPYETFVTADGELALAVGSERQWPRLCEVARDPRAGHGPAVRDERRPGRRTAAELRPMLAAAVPRPPDSGVARGPRRAPGSRAARSTTSSRRSRRRRRRPGR